MTMSQALLGLRQHRPGRGSDGTRADRAVPHGLALLGHGRLGERDGGPGSAGLLLGLQPHDHRAGALRGGRRRGRVGAQVLVGLLRRTAGGQGAPSPITDNADRPRVEDDQGEGHRPSSSSPTGSSRRTGASTTDDVNPNYFDPKQGLLRLQKVMDEYVAGLSAKYITNEPTLQRGLQLLLCSRRIWVTLRPRTATNCCAAGRCGTGPGVPRRTCATSSSAPRPAGPATTTARITPSWTRRPLEGLRQLPLRAETGEWRAREGPVPHGLSREL